MSITTRSFSLVDPFFVSQLYSQIGKSLAPNMFEAILLQPMMWQLKRPSMCSFNHILMNGLINHHVMGWKKEI